MIIPEPERGAKVNKQVAELTADSWRAVQKMTEVGLRQLADRPHLPPQVGRNAKRGMSPSGENKIHATKRTVIAPRSYDAPLVEGLNNVRLEETWTEIDVIRYRLFDTELFHRRERPVDQSVCVRLSKDFVDDTARAASPWRYGGRPFGMSTQGNAHPLWNGERRPAIHLAMAALVGQAINQAQGTEVPLKEAANLYTSWQEIDANTPEPPSSQHIWSILDERLF